MKDLTIQEVKGAITNQVWTNDDINSIVEAIKFAREQLARKTKRSLAVGDSVKFTGRNGRVHYGTVRKINIKKVIVKEGMTNWTVPASMLEAA